MKNYRDALSRFIATDFGGAAAPRAEAADATLRQDIHNVIQSDAKYFNLCVGMLILLFVGAISLVLLNLSHPGNVTAIFSATGISFAFLLKQMTALWREKSHAEVAYNLATRLSVSVRAKACHLEARRGGNVKIPPRPKNIPLDLPPRELGFKDTRLDNRRQKPLIFQWLGISY
jgi:hypothetical protein